MINIDRYLGIASCSDCMDETKIGRSILGNGERLMEFSQMYGLDHRDCHRFKDVRKAMQNRKFRKESERRRMLEIQQMRDRVWIS
jgi:hypothetical protein